ncbi:hypothetical protein NL676_030875 [Syzygium grande]|nr:hypothetical protein NL676_030875 [Syzygium grande]
MNCRSHSHTPTATFCTCPSPTCVSVCCFRNESPCTEARASACRGVEAWTSFAKPSTTIPLSCARFLQLNSVCRCPPTSCPHLTSWTFQSEVSSRQERGSVGRALKMLSLRFVHISHSTIANNSSLAKRDVRFSLDDLHKGGTTGQGHYKELD